jgi:hypothetical protein
MLYSVSVCWKIFLNKSNMKQRTRAHTSGVLLAGILSAITVVPSHGFSAQSAEEEVFAWRLRAGVAIPTEKVLKNVGNGTDVASMFNTDASYALKEWLRVGAMYEWHEHTINLWGPKFGNLTINTLLATVEFRVPHAKLDPHGLTWLTPYASLGFGANLHMFKEHAQAAGNTGSFPTTFAFRVATGIDFPLTEQLGINTEIAWNRDSGTYQFNGADASFNASTFNILGGIRLRY